MMQFSPAKRTPSLWRDMQRDWQGWTRLERLMASALCAGTLVTGAVCVLTLPYW